MHSFTYIFLPSDMFLIFLKLNVHYYYATKNIGHNGLLKENEHIFRYRAWLEGNFFRCVRARAHLRESMTRKSCTVGMRNAILRNHFKLSETHSFIFVDHFLLRFFPFYKKTGNICT